MDDKMDEQPWTKWTIDVLSILSMAVRPFYRPWLLVHVHYLLSRMFFLVDFLPMNNTYD